MKKEILWQEIVKQNPDWTGPERVNLSPRGLRKFFDLIYDQAHHQGVENGKILQKKDPDNAVDSFAKLFGGKL